MDQNQRAQLAKAVLAAMSERGWSQSRVADEANVAENTVASIVGPARPDFDWAKKPLGPQDGKLRAVLDALGIAAPGNSESIGLEGVPEDVARFLKVAVNRLKNIEDPDARARVLADVYPRLLVD